MKSAIRNILAIFVVFSFICLQNASVLSEDPVDEDFDESASEGEHSDESHEAEDEHYDKEGHHDEDYDHLAVTGSKAAADEYKELSPDEAQERLGKLADQMDTNKDGFVDKPELKEWIIKSFVMLDREEAKEKMEEEDINRDNTTDWMEHVTHTYGYTSGELDALTKENSNDAREFIKTLAEEKAKFDLADLNKDGHLDKEEYRAFIHPAHYNHMASYEINHTLKAFDKNKDGMINLAEFISQEDNPDQSHVNAERQHFKQYDKNGDGHLDRDEMVQWVAPGFEKGADEEAEHLFLETDVNKDNKLHKTEIKDQHELWVGSHATDYGRHLEHLEL